MYRECMASNLPGEWKPCLLKYLSADYASPIYLKPVMYESRNFGAQRHTLSYQFSQPNHRLIFNFGSLYRLSVNCYHYRLRISRYNPLFSSQRPSDDLASNDYLFCLLDRHCPCAWVDPAGLIRVMANNTQAKFSNICLCNLKPQYTL